MLHLNILDLGTCSVPRKVVINKNKLKQRSVILIWVTKSGWLVIVLPEDVDHKELPQWETYCWASCGPGPSPRSRTTVWTLSTPSHIMPNISQKVGCWQIIDGGSNRFLRIRSQLFVCEYESGLKASAITESAKNGRLVVFFNQQYRYGICLYIKNTVYFIYFLIEADTGSRN